MKNKLISVIMSTKDTEEDMLRSSIESILAQTYKKFEFIIICDGSINDLNIVQSYMDDRIVIINHEKSKGLTKSLNEALEIAKGDYIARMDSDDISLKNRFMIQINFMEKHKNIDICSTMVKNFGNSKKIAINLYNDFRGIKTQLFLYNCLAHPAIMMRKTFINANNIRYDENFRYSQDYELWSRCSKIGKLAVINKICLLYRVHPNQISTAKLSEQNDLCRYVYKKNIQELMHNDVEKYTDFLMQLNNRENHNYSIIECENFITNLLKTNSKKNIYDETKFAKVLYFKLFTSSLKKEEKNITIKLIMKYNIVGLLFKKIVLVFFYNVTWRLRNLGKSEVI